ncbi:MAG: hypothetical protein BalsKO_00120 [Balneolaceae bacterium]
MYIALVILLCSASSLFAQTITETDGNFNLYSNGTVKCTAATDGDTGIVNGITYTRRTKVQIQANHSLASTSCTSGITDMSFMFNGASSFNEDVSSWDVSNVTTMFLLFTGASSFNGDVSKWDVSNVVNMGNVFQQASSFNGNVSAWDVSSATNMYQMFFLATAFNQDLSSWCVSNLGSEPSNFSTSSALTEANKPVWGTCPDFRPLSNGVTVTCTAASNLETGTVGGITYTKRNSGQITYANAATSCTSGITSLSSKFNAEIGFVFDFNADISSWDVSSVTNMASMFQYQYDFNADISAWDVSNVTNMQNMFREADSFDRDISAWDVSSVTNMQYAFGLTDIFNSDLSAWDVSSVTNMSFMFFGAEAFNQDLSSWCITNIASEASNFSTSSVLTEANKPVWGTCPGKQQISGDIGWRLLSFPITGGTVNDISDDTPIQGITGGENESAAANFYFYDDTGVYEEPTNVTTAFGDGKGFAVYFYDNATAGSSELPVTLDAAGSEPSTNVPVTLNPAANGYTLVGNPFKSNFSADATNMAVSGADFIQNNISFWNDGLGSYSVQDRTTPYIVKPWQGFWVQLGATGGATTLTFNTSGKTASEAMGSFFSKTVASNRGDINFTFSSDSSYDEAIRMSFRDNATTGYDPDDAGKLIPLLSKYAIMGFNSNDLYKSVESLPWDLQEEITIPMEEVLLGVNGGFTLEWNGFESIPEQWALTFHDYEMETSVDMRVDSAYSFDATAPAAKVNPMSILNALKAPEAIPAKSKSQGTRFAITINPTSTTVGNEIGDQPNVFALEQNYPNPFNPSTTISYSVENAGPVSVSVYNVMGQKVAELVNATKTAGSYSVTWDASSVSSGMYFYQLTAGGQTLTKRMTLIK